VSVASVGGRRNGDGGGTGGQATAD
jgi:hypothetical protein